MSRRVEGVTVLPCHQWIVGTLDAGLDARFARGALVASILGLTGFSASGQARCRHLDADDTPGPAPNQSQINAAKSQVSAIEATLSQEEQQTSALDNRYDTAVQNLQTAQNALQTIDASIVRTKAAVKVDRQAPDQRRGQGLHLRHPAIELRLAVLVLGHLGDARTSTPQQIVGDLEPGPRRPADLRVAPGQPEDAGAEPGHRRRRPRRARRRRSRWPTSRRRRPPRRR
jgi:hypothetical protein